MMKSHRRSNLLLGHKLSAVTLFVCLAVPGAHSAIAVQITGVVTNGTTRRPAAGDRVVLTALRQRMQEIAKTTTDSKGHFSIESPDPGTHLLRVDHQGATYFQAAPPNTPNVDIQVYDVAKTVSAVTTQASALRIRTDQQGLQVSQTFFVNNSSNPPRTQFSDHSYEIYLPPGAKVNASAALEPGGTLWQAFPVPLADKNHYAFVFPLRPGETVFQLQYHLRNSGSLAFNLRLTTPATTFVVMMPKSMTFKPGAGTTFAPSDKFPGVQTYLVRNVTPSHSLAFTISGTGLMPRDIQNAEQSQGFPNGAGQGADTSQGAGDQAVINNRPGIGLANPIGTAYPLNKYTWWILGGIALVFAIAVGFLRRKHAVAGTANSPSAQTATNAAAGANSRLTALKNELFVLETDRMRGRVSEAEYGELKSALELTLRRALKPLDWQGEGQAYPK
jgi:Carboxypeptidase regulatory-like domain